MGERTSHLHELLIQERDDFLFQLFVAFFAGMGAARCLTSSCQDSDQRENPPLTEPRQPFEDPLPG